jgi:phosphoribosylformylglycinamidine synthase
VAGAAPRVDLGRERALIDVLVEAAAQRLIESAHDCADGGVAVTLAECAFESGGIGFSVDLPLAADEQGNTWTNVGLLFSEAGGRVIVSVSPGRRQALEALAARSGVPARVIGTTGGSRMRIAVAGHETLDVALAEMEQLWSSALGRYFAGRAA